MTNSASGRFGVVERAAQLLAQQVISAKVMAVDAP